MSCCLEKLHSSITILSLLLHVKEHPGLFLFSRLGQRFLTKGHTTPIAPTPHLIPIQAMRFSNSIRVLVALILCLHPLLHAAVLGHWRFEGTGSAFLADSSGNNISLMVVNTAPVSATSTGFPNPIPTIGQANLQAANFGLFQTGNFSAGDRPAFTVSDITVEAFAKLGAVTPGTQYIAAQWAFTGGNQRSWGFAVAGSTPPAGLAQGELFMVASANGSTTFVLGSGLVIPVGTAQHLAVSFDSQSRQLTFRSTDLATALSRIAIIPLNISGFFNSAADLNIGSYNGNALRWTGLLDEVRLHNSAQPELLININQLPPVTIAPPGGSFDIGPVNVTLSSVADGEIRYTLDGSEPVAASPLYSAPFPLNASGTIRTRLFSGDDAGPITAADFTIIGSPRLGRVVPRHSREIASSNFSIGAETMDRDYTVYENWKTHLGPLGAKKARIQSGWAKTELVKGTYDFTWIDAIVNDMIAQGVEPWVTICYGNPIYAGGGGIDLGDGLPTSATALAAWDAYVTALVTRYANVIDEWEVWNEPDNGSSAAQYADFYMRTAAVIRAAQPASTILLGAYTYDAINQYNTAVMNRIQTAGNLGLIDKVTYHPYASNPDSTYTTTLAFRDQVKAYDTRIWIRQGENEPRPKDRPVSPLETRPGARRARPNGHCVANSATLVETLNPVTSRSWNSITVARIIQRGCSPFPETAFSTAPMRKRQSNR